jgi:hypothetical protein
VNELADALSEALGQQPGVPAEPDLGRGIRAEAFWSFAPSLEIVVAQRDEAPSDAQALAAWRARLDKRPVPLVLMIESPGGTTVVGPGGDPPPVVELEPKIIFDDLVAAAELDPIDVRQRLPMAWARARDAGELTGLRNVGLFSSHYLRARAPRLEGWHDLEALGRVAARESTPVKRLERLGFDVSRVGEGIYLLRTEGRPAAAVLAWPDGRDLDRAAPGGELPVAGLLREMDAAGTDWGILASGDVWRLHNADNPSRMTSFAEVDLAKLSNTEYFAGLFSAQALRRDGLAERIATGSREFAVGLGDRLRERIYERVVPAFVTAIARELEAAEQAPRTRAELDGVYDATLTLLYRLLFVLYAEAREFLPVSASAGYRDHSLGEQVQRIAATVEAGREFDPSARDIWTDLSETFSAVRDGHTEWGVPPYNGGLFSDAPDRPGAALLAQIAPTNAGLGPPLYALAVDADDEDTGRIDFSDLGIRHLGDIYEGLLQFEADRAREDLAYDAKADAYVPASEGAEVRVAADTVYLRSRSGGRKASGSYYTPQIVVRHLVREALVPVHDDHLAAVRRLIEAGNEESAAAELWAFRVCDPAMGSGHFLVDALDVLTDRTAAFLSEHPLKPVRAVLGSLREMVQAQAKDLPAGVLAEIRDVDLLKRVVLKRSIYGVDQNPMAAELARLALWLDAFVPGLPLSYLDHNLKCGNSLVGVVGDEVLDAVRPDVATLEGDWMAERLREATLRAREAVEGVELRLADVEAARGAEQQRSSALLEVESLYDRWTADSFGLVEARARIAQRETLEAEADSRDAIAIATEQRFFHWPLEFPEIFGRARAGFDVVLANPPWEKLKVERHDFFQFRIPGLKFVSSAAEREARIQALIERDPSAQADYETTMARVERLKRYFQPAAGNYTLHGGGDADLFKAFGERFLRLVRLDGAIGCVLPRQLLGGAGSAPLRRELFEHWRVLSADVLWNRRVWAFPDVFHRTRMTLLAVRRQDPGSDPVVPSAGPLGDAERFARARDLRVRYRVKDLASWSQTLELPSLPDPEAGRVFEAMLRHPRFDAEERAWRARPYCELHSTADRDLYNENGRGWPVWKGRTFERYQPDIATPVYWAEPDATLARLEEKRLGARGAFDGFPSATLADPSTLPPWDCRIVFRDVVRATDRRTMKACLAPARVFAIHDAPQLIWPCGDAQDVTRLLAILNSLPFDWLLRRRVETHVTFGILDALPVPDAGDASSRLVELAGRLSCVDERYADWASRIGLDGVSAGSQADRAGMEAEIDALVARAYGLSEADLVLIFGDFVEAALPTAQRELILQSFRSLA